MPAVHPGYFAEILAGTAEAPYEHDMRVVLCPTRHSRAREMSLLDRLAQGETDGAILVLPEESSAELRALALVAGGHSATTAIARIRPVAGIAWNAGGMAEADALTDLDRALAATETVVAGIRDGQWPAPTPCTELDVRAVLSHLVSGNLLFAALVQGEPLPDRGADHLGTDPLTAFQRAARELREAFATPGVLESVYTAPFGTGPGAALLQVRIVEVLAHGWDLARATGQPAAFPGDVAERALAATTQQLASRPEGPGAPFAAEVPVADDAPAIDRLAGFLGRCI